MIIITPFDKNMNKIL